MEKCFWIFTKTVFIRKYDICEYDYLIFEKFVTEMH